MLDSIRDLLVEYLDLRSFRFPGTGITDIRIDASNIADMLIVAVMIYFGLRWVRKSRAWTLLRGILLLVVLYALASMFDFVAITTIVQSAFEMGFIALIVLFQPEFRKALEQIGRGSYIKHTFSRGGEPSLLSLHTVNEIVKASYAMGKAKTGALMVLEQNNDLSEFESTGIAVDALVSSQLLINIFEKNTPLHDGAVLIRQNRVVAAACILPLTGEEVDSSLGTRHRASIGMSEVTDAIVVVVSEETGAVSVSDGGALHRNLNDNKLREFLMKSDGSEEVKPRSFNLFKKNKAE
jgi:diadenylate cyclase